MTKYDKFVAYVLLKFCVWSILGNLTKLSDNAYNKTKQSLEQYTTHVLVNVFTGISDPLNERTVQFIANDFVTN